MVFCNRHIIINNCTYLRVTILILVDGFLQFGSTTAHKTFVNVTILILVDGFLQSGGLKMLKEEFLVSQSLF